MTARVLVVDDLVPNVKLLEAKLTAEYFDVITASDGPSALQIIAAEGPDIVLLDVMMPGMDGFEVCRRIKGNPKTQHIPVVMVTALSETSNRVHGLECGADDFLTKPVNDTALMARIRSLVRLKMLMDEWRMREETGGSFGMLSNEAKFEDVDGKFARVLIVDDNQVNSGKIAKALENNGHIVTTVASGDDAFKATDATAFDMIVISLLLREEDGLRLCSRLRSQEHTRQVPILLVIEEEDTQRLATGLEIGANDYIIRPIDGAELLARTRTQVRRKRTQDRLRHNYERSLAMALTDSLTGLYNRRYVMAHLEGLVVRAQQSGKQLSALMFDIDHFKSVNDSFGHAVGDEVLRELAARVGRNVRGFDLTARLGGEEFLVVMPDTSIDVAMTVAERLRDKIDTQLFTVSTDQGELHVTVSIGGATLGETDTPDSLLKRADDALYEAKNSGRNRVIQADPPSEPGTTGGVARASAANPN